MLLMPGTTRISSSAPPFERTSSSTPNVESYSAGSPHARTATRAPDGTSRSTSAKRRARSARHSATASACSDASSERPRSASCTKIVCERQSPPTCRSRICSRISTSSSVARRLVTRRKKSAPRSALIASTVIWSVLPGPIPTTSTLIAKATLRSKSRRILARAPIGHRLAAPRSLATLTKRSRRYSGPYHGATCAGGRRFLPALMIQGTASSAGKSLVTTALARAFARRGLDVVPFKAQNMSNNARVVDGGEIGVAQYLQALAAGIEPDVRMNPVLVKPEGDNRSQVIVLGKPDLELSRLPWRERSAALWPPIEEALQSLLAEHELVLLEGAGSPAEINLRDTDLANMRSARVANARVLLVCDIDRGGAFAHLYGTWALLPPDEQELLFGFVLNKFRGDEALLEPAPRRLEELTGVPTLGVLPWLDHGLPDEDGAAATRRRSGRPRVAVVRYPTASNLDEFKLLEQVADVRWAAGPEDLDGSSLIVLPGSKHVAADLAWLLDTGVGNEIRARAREGRRVLGVCGGLQMLGTRLEGQSGVGGGGEGLGLLPLGTRFHVG